MAVLPGYIVILLSVYRSHAYDGYNKGYTLVPHENIQSDETEINLEKNKITELFSNEFSEYTKLIVLSLRQNKIRSISSSAFNGTQLNHLDLSLNKLVTTPDLSMLSATLEYLNIKHNLFTNVPNITLHLTDAVLIFGNRSKKVLDENISEVCQIGNFRWTQSKLQSIPDFLCESSAIHILQLWKNSLNEHCDFTKLETISNSLKSLGLSINLFTQFPVLPQNVRKNLQKLVLNNNMITTISDDVLTGYNLTYLALGYNIITAIPDDLFLAGQSINLEYNPLNDWDQYKWNEMICRASSLTTLDLSGSLISLTQIPDIRHSICSTPTHETLTMKLESIPGPCDCSVQWMADVVQQGCPLNLLTDTLQCGKEVVDLNLTCPQSGLILYQNENFTGDSHIIEDSTLAESLSVTSYAVIGEQAWVVHASPPDISNKMLHPGRYASQQEAGLFKFYIHDEIILKLQCLQ